LRASWITQRFSKILHVDESLDLAGLTKSRGLALRGQNKAAPTLKRYLTGVRLFLL
jgi:hypothetical protein